eukprot:scaffold194140_cov35-Tisochrysis_lutea.AAC.2
MVNDGGRAMCPSEVCQTNVCGEWLKEPTWGDTGTKATLTLCRTSRKAECNRPSRPCRISYSCTSHLPRPRVPRALPWLALAYAGSAWPPDVYSVPQLRHSA